MISSVPQDSRRNCTNGLAQGQTQLPEHRYHITTGRYSSHSSHWHSRAGSFQTTPEHSNLHTRHESEASQELEFSPSNGPTRDSMVEGMLQSLNELSDASGPVPSLEPYQTSFPNGKFRPSFEPRDYHHAQSQHGGSLSSGSHVFPPIEDASSDSTPYASPRKLHKRRYTATHIKSKFNSDPTQPGTEERGRLTNFVTQARGKEKRRKSFENTRVTRQHLKQGDMESPRSSHARDESPPADYDLNPQDHQIRRRSRTHNNPGSVLNRSRPVPPEYHVFDDTVRLAETARNALQKSTTYPNNLDNPVRQSLIATQGMANRSTHHRGSVTGLTEQSPVRAEEIGASASHNGIGTSSRGPYADSFTSSSSRGQLDPGSSLRQKEKAGFLKRMFGSSRTNSSSDLRQQAPQIPPVQLENRRDAGRVQSVQEQEPLRSASIPKAPPIPQSDPEKQQPPQQLRQKTSFFRRRRKTLTEKDMTRVPKEQNPPSPHGGVPVPGSDRPSTSSLRQVMNPYISNSTPRRKKSEVDTDVNSLEDVPTRPKAEKQSAYEFLRSTSPGSTGTQSKGRTQPMPTHRRRTSPTSSKENRSRPPTTARESKRPNDHDMEHRGRGQRPMNELEPKMAKSSHSSNSRRRSATTPEEVNAKFPDNRSTPQVPAVPRIETSPAGRRGSAHPLTAPTETGSSRTKDKDSWLLSTPHRRRDSSSRGSSSRVWVENEDSSDDNLHATSQPVEPYVDSSSRNKPNLSSDVSSTREDFTSAKSEISVPTMQLEDLDEDRLSPLATEFPPSYPAPTPSSEEQRARQIFEAPDSQARAQGALELGEAGERADRLRSAFMAHFDSAGLNILLALRDLCEKMTLKGETQQMDRIMSAFSRRWCQCNPNHGFKSEDVVHTICYSLLLLNTDLHVADLTDKMTRTQFVKNTIPTLRRVAEADDTSIADSTLRASRNQARGAVPFPEERSNSVAEIDTTRISADDRGTASRLLSKQSLRPTSEIPPAASPSPYDRPTDPSELLVNTPHEGTMKGWETALETVLKEFYLSVRQLRLPLHGAEEVPLHEQPSSNSLSVVTNIMRRTGSVISKTPSEDSRGRASTFRSAASRFTSKNRSRPRLYPTSTLGSSRTASRTSLEDSTMWSPSASSITSQGKSLTTMSTESLAPRFSPVEQGYQQSIGFANALSHVIIREEGTGPTDDAAIDGDVQLLDDESLELAGAPWAKEGILQHKHHREMEGKKARDRNWSECFAVIQRGHMRLFSFNNKSKGLQKNKPAVKAGAVVGGGNWLENAESIASFTLLHTIANALPPPGYSKQRPHVFALSLPTGAVHLFHVGTSEIAQEFVMTANYWSARLSKEPLVGGVSNIEYGWGESVINTALVGSSSASDVTAPATSKSNLAAPPSSFHLPFDSSSVLSPAGRTSSSGGRSLHSPTPSGSISIQNSGGLSSDRAGASGRPSINGSLRSSFDAPRPAAMRNRLPADRLMLSSWHPPQQSLMPSRLPEAEQLNALKTYVHSVEEELCKHNELRPGLALAFSPRSVNATKAMGNWERKSQYLLREIVKFRTYVDVLEVAEQRRTEVKGERAQEHTTPGTKGARPKAEEDDLELSEETMEALRFTRAKRTGTGDTETGSSR